MTLRQALVALLVAALLVMAVHPARAEALEPNIILLVVSAGVVVLVILAYLIIANAESYRRGDRVDGTTPALPVVVLVEHSAIQTP
jgi:hypothetical protein